MSCRGQGRAEATEREAEAEAEATEREAEAEAIESEAEAETENYEQPKSNTVFCYRLQIVALSKGKFF